MQSSPAPDTTHPNQALLASIYDAFARGDIATAMAPLDDDIEWHVNGPRSIAGTYRGKQEVLDWFPRMTAPYQGTLQVEVQAVLADDRHGAVRVKESAGRPDAITYTGVHLWEFSRGRCTRFESLYDDAYIAFWSARSDQERNLSGS